MCCTSDHHPPFPYAQFLKIKVIEQTFPSHYKERVTLNHIHQGYTSLTINGEVCSTFMCITSHPQSVPKTTSPMH